MLAYQITLLLVQEERAEDVAVKRDMELRIRRKRSDDSSNFDFMAFNQKSCKGPVPILAFRHDNQNIQCAAIIHNGALTACDAENIISDILQNQDIDFSSFQVTDFHEITLSDCYASLLEGESNNMLRCGFRIYGELGLSPVKELLESPRRWDNFRVEELLPTKFFATKRDALTHAARIMGHHTIREEISRIYHTGNHRRFVEHPVHYYIRANSRDTAREIIEALVGSLYMNGRVPGSRISYFHDFDSGSNKEKFMRGYLEASSQSTVAMELSSVSKMTTESRKILEEKAFLSFLVNEVRDKNRDTLFIFVEINQDSSECALKGFLQEVSDFIDVIALYEGNGDAKAARSYLDYLADAHGRTSFSPADLESISIGNYTPTKVREIYRELYKNRLCNEYFPSYRKVITFPQSAEISAESTVSSLDELKSMIGLRPLKNLLNRIIAVHKMGKLQQGLGLKKNRQALHMAFMGNPGTAKTTAARLLADVLKENGILATGVFVECGRSDLVGRYVGWTAKNVRQKFQDAAGGILFIDEAYSLLDSSNSFGAEAINTIVQEMENRRDDVLVVLAGYTDRMNDFIDSNEGLRSRIGFHIEFPDYNVDELSMILEYMAKERGYRLNPSIIKKCRGYFTQAVKHENFGNGRYVRNLLDAAIMRQAERIIDMGETRKISRQRAACLSVKDFEPVVTNIVKTKPKVGFMVEYANSMPVAE